MVYSRTEHVFLLEQYFPLKSFAVVREAFNSSYSDNEVPNTTTIRPTDTGSVRDRYSVEQL
jgi:hypothetical protein